jgi:hypothetical protein
MNIKIAYKNVFRLREGYLLDRMEVRPAAPAGKFISGLLQQFLYQGFKQVPGSRIMQTEAAIRWKTLLLMHLSAS